MVLISELNPSTAATIKKIIIELASYKRRFRTRRSQPVTLGSRTPVIVNPSQKDTETKIGNDDNTFEWLARRVIKKITPWEIRAILS